MTDGECRDMLARMDARNLELSAQVAALSVKLEEAQALRDGILAAYREDDTREACDACEQCGAVFLCSFHTVLSLLAGRTKLGAEWARKSEASPGEIVKVQHRWAQPRPFPDDPEVLDDTRVRMEPRKVMGYAPQIERGEVVKACPQCGMLDPTPSIQGCELVCKNCQLPVTAPAYYQKVPRPSDGR